MQQVRWASETPLGWIRPYYPAFNALRAAAVLAVFAHHWVPLYVPGAMASGWMGVDLFFVLSGFLITGILVDSRKSRTFFRDFYTRRALRIFPLYYGVFAIIILLWLASGHLGSKRFFLYALYVGNLVMPFCDLARHNPTSVQLPWASVRIDHFWSLCVEEQFYLIWPIVVWFCPRRATLMRICVGGIVGALALRCCLWHLAPARALNQLLLYESTYTRCDSLLAGALLALWLRERRMTPARFKWTGNLLTWTSLGLLLLGGHLAGANWKQFPTDPFISTIGYSLVASCFVGVIMLAIDESSVLHRLLIRSKIGVLGRFSYGFYVFQSLFIPAFAAHMPRSIGHGHPVRILLSIAFAFVGALAWLSFTYFENPFIRLKDRFAPADHRSVPA